MAINVVRFEHQGRTAWGVLRGARITPVAGEFATTGEFIAAMPVAALQALQGTQLDLAAVRVLSPVTRNQQFVCQGANYRQHMIESGVNPDDKKFNMIFTKARSCIVPADSDVIRPRIVQFLDYEIELGLVMRSSITGKREITDANLHEFVAGIVIVNDYSARDIQIPQMQFYKGKSYRSFGPAGPVLLLLEAAEWKRWPELRMRLTVNGETRQETLCGDMLFAPHQTLTELSALQDLHAGDLIATGTPAGCAAKAPGKLVYFVMNHLLSPAAKWKLFIHKGLANPLYLKPGDQMTASIRTDDGALDLGEQRNRIVAA